jgi:hypothetical protein
MPGHVRLRLFPGGALQGSRIFRRREVRRLPAGIYRYIATVESVLGWLLRALFLVSLGRTMIR